MAVMTDHRTRTVRTGDTGGERWCEWVLWVCRSEEKLEV